MTGLVILLYMLKRLNNEYEKDLCQEDFDCRRCIVTREPLFSLENFFNDFEKQGKTGIY